MHIHSLVPTFPILETELSERGLFWGERPAAHREVGMGEGSRVRHMYIYNITALLDMNTSGWR